MPCFSVLLLAFCASDTISSVHVSRDCILPALVSLRCGQLKIGTTFVWFFNNAALNHSLELGGISALVACNDMFFDAHASLFHEIISSVMISCNAISLAQQDIGVPIMRKLLELGGVLI